MKNKISFGCLSLLFLMSSSHAATIAFDSFINQGNQRGKPTHIQFENAIAAAGNGGTVNLGSKTYNIKTHVIIKKRVNIVGKGRGKTRINSSGGRVFFVGANGVVIRNLRAHKSSSQFGITINGYSNVRIENSTLSGANYAIDNNFGKPVDGLVIKNNDFRGITFYGFWCISRSQFNGAAPRQVGRFIFENNQIYTHNASKRQPRMGVTIDYGNERERSKGFTPNHGTNRGPSLIKNNTIHGMGEHDIAIARAQNILIQGNTLYGGSVNGYTQALHLEDRSGNITATGNKLYNNKTGKGAHAATLEASHTFNDWKSWNININNNQVRSRARTAMQFTDVNRMQVKGNRFESPRASQHDIGFWNSPRGGYSNVDTNGNFNNARVNK